MAAPLAGDDTSLMLTLALERADGIERIVFKSRVARELLDNDQEPEYLIARLTPWIEHEFEQVREAALKSIRTERRLFELIFDSGEPGPFRDKPGLS
ncbi:MAG: hypothetical protein ACREQD_13210 [Candidatus Binataceae bacterium]